VTTELGTTLAADLEPEAFVRRALAALEAGFREAALLALVDWARLGVVSPRLFPALGALARPSWGAWNGLLAALRAAVRDVAREGEREARAALEEAAALKAVLGRLDERAPPALAEALEPLAELTGASRRRLRLGQVYAMAIALRNVVAHDAPTDPEWWVRAAAALRPLAAHEAAERPLAFPELPRPAPWFHEVGGDRLAFAGFGRGSTVYFAAPGEARTGVPERSGELLRAFGRLMGKEQVQERDFAALLGKLAPEEIKGVLLGDYLVGPPVGRGGFATVHVARQLSTGRRVALKVLHDGLPEEARARFQQEAAYLSRFDHPHIVRVLGYGEGTWSKPRGVDLTGEAWFEELAQQAPHKSYLALEWVAGETLEARFGGEAPVRRLTEWFAQAADALADVHGAGLIHRDVKPSNMMVRDDGGLVLMDFGVARTQDETRTLLTTTGRALGTPAYMAPEQIRAAGGDAEVGPAADVYALCATFYELYTGARLYGHDTEGLRTVETKKLQGERPRRPRAIAAALPWEVEAVLLGGLETEPSDRYRTMRDLERDLRHVLRDEPIEYRRPSALRRLQLAYRRHRLVTHLVAVFVVVIALGVAQYVRAVRARRVEAEEQARIAAAERAAAEDARAEAEAARADAERQGRLAARRAEIAQDALQTLVHEVRDELDDVASGRVREARLRLLERALAGMRDLRDASVEAAPASTDAILAQRQVAALAGVAGRGDEALAAARAAVAAGRRLVAARSDDPEAQLALARALRDLGHDLSNRGDLAEAVALLEESLALLEAAGARQDVRSSEVGTRTSLGATLRRRGELAAARAHLEAALALQRALLSESPGPEVRHDLLVGLVELADTLELQGALDGAVAATDEAIAVVRAGLTTDPDSRDLRHALTTALLRRARFLKALGDIEGAVAAAEEALAASRAHLELDPTGVTARESVAACLGLLGGLRTQEGDFDAAMAAYERSIALYRGLIADDPGRTWFLSMLAVVLDRVGSVRGEELGDEAGALASYEEALAIRRRLRALDPDDSVAIRTVASSLDKIGTTLSELGRAEAALERLEEAVALRREVLAGDRSHTVAREELAVSLRRLGSARAAGGDVEAGLALLEESRELTAALSEDQPDAARLARQLVVVLQDAARVLRGLGRTDEALARLAAAEERARALVALEERSPSALHHLTVSLNQRGKTLRAAGRPDAADAPLEESLAVSREIAAATGTPRARYEVGLALTELGENDQARGDLASALERLGEARRLLTGLSAESPDDLQFLDALALAGLTESHATWAAGDPAGALAVAEETIPALRRLVAARPTDPSPRRELAVLVLKTGLTLANAGQLEDGLARVEEAREVYAPLAGQGAELDAELGRIDALLDQLRAAAGRPADGEEPGE